MTADGRGWRTAADWLTGGGLGARVAHLRPPRPVPVAAPQPPAVPEDAEAAAGDNESTGLGSRPADPYRRLPAGMAKLLVQPARDRDGNRGYLLTGTADGGPPLPALGPHLPPTGIRLSRLQSEAEPGTTTGLPSELYRAVRHWSRQDRQRPLLTWLTDLRRRHGDALHVVVWDDTDFEIPWELLTLEPLPAAAAPPAGPPLAAAAHNGAAPPGEPLGAAVTVARWTTTCEEAAPLLAGPAACAGGVLSYFDGEMTGDSAAFRHVAHRPHTDADDFLTALGAAGGAPPGLVYMGCHGTHGAALEQLRLDRLTWYELDEQPMPVLARRGTAVVLNVCHSGRMVDNKAGGEDALRGFSELFLRRGATACVATGGQVGDTVAREMLVHLVAHTGRTPERPLALMLRDFRAGAAAALPDPLPRAQTSARTLDLEGQREVMRFLYRFMYLYYGHPRTTLRLAPRTPDGAP